MSTPSSPAVTPHLILEFTVEPFVEGRPGPHVLAAFAAAQDHPDPDLAVDIGPFGTTVRGPAQAIVEISHRVTAAAFAHGATRVSLQVSTATV